MAEMIKALIFDFYGVIYGNFNWDIIDSRIYSDENKARAFVDLKTSANRGDISNEELLEQVAKLAEDEKHPNNPAVKFGPSINYAALGLVESLKHKFKIGLLSNGTHEHISRVFKELQGTDKFFDIVITSSDTQFIKPSKEAFISAARKLGVEPDEVLIIDDSAGHIEGAKKAGLKTIKFDDMDQLRREFEHLEIY